jgi:hypothetical protein
MDGLFVQTMHVNINHINNLVLLQLHIINEVCLNHRASRNKGNLALEQPQAKLFLLQNVWLEYLWHLNHFHPHNMCNSYHDRYKEAQGYQEKRQF